LAKKKEITVDISKHIFIPNHKILDESEAEAIFKTYNISRSQLPSISIKDPMAQKLDAELNSIIEIIRLSPHAGEYKYYRRVVE
tara:strand:- start:87 stop:338 length:252 start_codon:yes stop_codon:yes gene_type:complete